jgi:eukaryotic-like serine/threonine-protein kinase
MAILPRKRLGPYEIPSSIGTGGIGQIYRVRNTLNRAVALNPLSEVFSSNRERMPHFEREAPALTVLNHSPVAALYSLEGNLVPAENLAARHQQLDSGLKK